ncbi:SBBP repeat-containing protein [Geobacter sp. AOG2]|uniref:SBBP repeat-containing protein n=1 Tax=Geobacter sp. AOG2 TaxID=1566347 RepID=UPI001CC36C0D|nr:SBBP repeat-containing protein [Geobacter sp. AOG2]
MLLVCLLVVCLLTACSGIVSTRPARVTDLQWPPKPYQARIKWVQSIADYNDAGIAKGFWKKVAEFFTGPDTRRIVRPYGVLCDGQDRLFIADPGAGVVHMMDRKKGRYVVIGDKDTRLKTPIGLAQDERGYLYISDSTNDMVYRYDIDRETLTPFVHRSLSRPTGIAYNKVNKLLYVVETTACRVTAFDQDGVERFHFGSQGETLAQFNRPTDIMVDAKGQVYVTDPLNYRIKMFAPEGVFVSQFGVAGDAPGDLNKPKGIAVDSAGNVYVCDALQDAVQIFDRQGHLLMTFGSQGERDGEFWMPSGISIDYRNRIYVSDTYNRRIQVFRYISGEEPENGDDQEDEQNSAR